MSKVTCVTSRCGDFRRALFHFAITGSLFFGTTKDAVSQCNTSLVLLPRSLSVPGRNISEGHSQIPLVRLGAEEATEKGIVNAAAKRLVGHSEEEILRLVIES